MGQHVIVKIDQWSSKYIMERREMGGQYQRWIMKLMAFDFTIVYNPRVSNKVVDALSCRNHDELEMKTLISTKSIDWDLL